MGKVIKVIDLFNMIERKEIKDKQKFRVVFKNNMTRDIYYEESEGLSICSLKNCSDDYDFADEYNLDDEVEILDEEQEIDNVNAYKLMEAPYMAECLRNNNFDKFMELLKQSELEVVEKLNNVIDKIKEK